VATLRFWQSPGQPLPSVALSEAVCVPEQATHFSVANGTDVASRMSVAFELAI